MQDIIALAVAIAAAVWLAWAVVKRCLAPPCRPPVPGGGDGFVPLEQLKGPANKNRGVPKDAPIDGPC